MRAFHRMSPSRNGLHRTSNIITMGRQAGMGKSLMLFVQLSKIELPWSVVGSLSEP